MVFLASEERQENHLHVLLVATGSVASIKVPLIVEKLLTYDKVLVEVIATKAALNFVSKTSVEAWDKIGDPILHIELRRWADVILVAPCSANTLAKIASGLCDNLATSVLRALAPTTPTFVFPAMNTHMYEHPLTTRHLSVIQDTIGYTVVGPIGKALACGDIGMGAMTEWTDIVQLVVARWSLLPKSMALQEAPAKSIPKYTEDLETGIPTLEDLAQNYPPMFTWDQVKDQVDSGDLAALKRHPALQKRYDAWILQVKEAHGSVVNFLINVRLGWGPQAPNPQPPSSNLLKPPGDVLVRPITPGTIMNKEWFTADIQDSLVKILPNDWPYSVPPEIRHYVVWSRLPITHPGIVPAQIWDQIVQDGLWGFSGSAYKPKGSGVESIDELVRQAGSEVRKYVEAKWPAEDYEVAWFVNPPRLQSIPGLAHLHVFARKKKV
ncbi:Flavoprotein [Ceratobasidium sp. AG-Ba]|nr:Flavoprotein [Ceratobasidium sp. AG-Ba]